MNTYRKSTLLLLVTLITLLSLFLDVGSVDAKRGRKRRNNHKKVDIQQIHQDALDLTLQQIRSYVPPLEVTTPCEPFTDKDCATDLRYRIN